MAHVTTKIKRRKEKKKVKKKLTVSSVSVWESIPVNTQCKNSFAPSKTDARERFMLF